MQYENARAKFEQDYQDIASDPTMNQMVMTALNGTKEKPGTASQSQTYSEAFDKAATEVITWRDGVIEKVTGAPVKHDQSGKPSRVDAKSALTPEVKSVKTKATKPVEIPETAADIVREMQAARGQ